MALPNKTQISNAVEKPSSFIAPQLKGYKVRTGILGPELYSGGFCIVFPIDKGNEHKALRVWHTEILNIKERYRLISNDIAHAKMSFLSNVEYIEKGLQVGGEFVDVVLMDWIDGLPLKTYISKVLSSTNTVAYKKMQLIQLANNLMHTFNSMHSIHFAHGDLQHDNIIVQADGKVKLIDYDNFYTPSLQNNFYQTTTGYSGYQHPIRTHLSNPLSSEKDDYFAELIIYLSIIAISKDLSLWDIAKDDDYALLLTLDDYNNIKRSTIYVDLLSLSNHQIKQLLNILELYLSKSSISDLEPFDVILYRLNKTPEIKVFRSNKSSYLIGDDIRLIWDVDVYTQLLLNGRDVTNQKKSTIIANGQSVFVLEAINNNKRLSKQISIKQYPRPIISFQATKLKIHANKGENVELKWNVQNALKCNILYDDVVRSNVGGSGMITVRPETTTIYTLQVLGLDGATYIEEQLTIDVFPDAEFTFNIDKDVVLEGEPFTLSWNVNNAKQVRLNGAIVKHNDSLIISGLHSETNYELAVYDEFGSKKTNITIKPKPKPQIISFRSSTDKIHKRKNNQVVLTWDVRNSVKVCLFRDGIFLNDCLPSGNVSFNLDDTAQFTLQVLGLNHTTKIEEKIIVNAFPDAEVEFKADKQYVLPDIPFHLSWKVVNAKRVIFDGKDVSHSDDIIIKNGIKKPTEYQLKVEDEFGTKKYPIYINLLNPPQIKTINIPKPPTMVSETHYTFHIPEFRLFKVSSPYVEVSHYKKVSFREVKERYKPYTFKIIRSLIMKNTILAKLYSSIKQKLNND